MGGVGCRLDPEIYFWQSRQAIRLPFVALRNTSAILFLVHERECSYDRNSKPDLSRKPLRGLREQTVVGDGEIVVRPMMYIALTYNHRLMDEFEAVCT